MTKDLVCLENWLEFTCLAEILKEVIDEVSRFQITNIIIHPAEEAHTYGRAQSKRRGRHSPRLPMMAPWGFTMQQSIRGFMIIL